MPRFTDDELHRLSKKHRAPRPVVPGAPAWSVDALQLTATWGEQATLRRFAETPAYDDAAAQRALLPAYTDLTGMDRWARAAEVRGCPMDDGAGGTRMGHIVYTRTTPAARFNSGGHHGPFPTLAEAMDVARAEARYIVQRPAQPTPATPDRVAELRATAFADPTDPQEVCS